MLVVLALAIVPAQGLPAQGALPQALQGPIPPAVGRHNVQVGIAVRPDTVTVGDPFHVVVRVKVPVSARVIWPALDDTTAMIALRAPMVRREGPSDVSGREEFAEFPVAAWDTGWVRTNWAPALVVVGEDTVPVQLADAGVYVQSVLSADTAEHVPRPAKPPFALEIPWWERWWPVLLVLAALAALAYLLWRRRRRVVRRPVAPRLGPFEHAMYAFDRLERLALSEADEHGRVSTLAMDILRGFLTARIPVTSRAQTSAELLAAVGDDTRVPLPRLIDLLVLTDAVKFARRRLTAVDARGVLADARGIVEAVEEVERTRRAHAEAMARAEARGDRPSGMSDPPARTTVGAG